MDRVEITHVHNGEEITTYTEGRVQRVRVNDEVVYGAKPIPLKVGDFVRCRPASRHYSTPNAPFGLAGKVVSVLYDKVAVEFPEFTIGHDCDARTANGHGWWFLAKKFTEGHRVQDLEHIHEEDNPHA